MLHSVSYRDEREALRAEKKRLEDELERSQKRLEELEHADPNDEVIAEHRRRRSARRKRLVVVWAVFVVLAASNWLLRVRAPSLGWALLLLVLFAGSLAYVDYVFSRCPRCEGRLRRAETRCPHCAARLK
jgi:Flp pilus assembly protein TadB